MFFRGLRAYIMQVCKYADSWNLQTLYMLNVFN